MYYAQTGTWNLGIKLTGNALSFDVQSSGRETRYGSMCLSPERIVDPLKLIWAPAQGAGF